MIEMTLIETHLEERVPIELHQGSIIIGKAFDKGSLITEGPKILWVFFFGCKRGNGGQGQRPRLQRIGALDIPLVEGN